VFIWSRLKPFVRCHSSEYGGTEFNARGDISQRFRPFRSRSRTVPTLYGSETLEGALSETLFHAVPPSDNPDRERESGRRLRITRVLGWQLSRVTPKRELKLVDLRDEALDDLETGLTRAALIESPAAHYPETAAWASCFFHCPLEPDGLVWNSRQAPSDLAMILFARGRVARESLSVVDPAVPLTVGEGLQHMHSAAERLGITLIQ
jgi:RES domain-containing protein